MNRVETTFVVKALAGICDGVTQMLTEFKTLRSIM
jgi:hypothetical protein